MEPFSLQWKGGDSQTIPRRFSSSLIELQLISKAKSEMMLRMLWVVANSHCVRRWLCVGRVKVAATVTLNSNNQFPEEAFLVSWCFEPSQPRRITSGPKTNFTLSPSHSFHESSYHKSCLCSLFIFRGHSTREPASSRVTYFILRAYTGTMC